jgi:hypothetical protein
MYTTYVYANPFTQQRISELGQLLAARLYVDNTSRIPSTWITYIYKHLTDYQSWNTTQGITNIKGVYHNVYRNFI